MGEFTGASSSLSGHYERQQRLSLKATQAKNQRLVHKFDITKSSIDREQRKEMKQWEKTRKDVLVFLSRIHVSSGSSIKKNEIRVPRQEAKTPNTVHMNNWVTHEVSKDNLSDVIDEVNDFNNTYSGHARIEEDIERIAFSIPPDSGQELDLASVGSEWTPDEARNDAGITEFTLENEDEQTPGSGARTKKWVQVQTQRITGTPTRDSPAHDIQVKSGRSMTLPNIARDTVSSLSNHHSTQQRRNSEDTSYAKRSSKSQVGRKVSTYARANPRLSGPCNDRFRKRRNYAREDAEEQRSLQYRLMEAAKRREILAKANQEAQEEVEDTMFVLRDEKWAQHLNNVKSRRAETGARKDAVSVLCQKDDDDSTDSRSTVPRQTRLLRRASIPSVTIPTQNRHKALHKKTSNS